MALRVLLILTLAASAWAATLADLCTASYVAAKLPTNNLTGITFDTSSIVAKPYYNVSIGGQVAFPNGTGLNYCNVTFAYSHDGANDRVNLRYLLPDPALYQNRFLATGGGGLAINSGSTNGATNLLHGIIYGASAGLTDGGFGSFAKDLTSVLLLANGTTNYRALYSFAYEGIREMSVIGKQLSLGFYNSSRIYSYYFGCSEGGREGWSQIQRYGDEYDGAVVGAPAFRQAYQQVNHLTSNVIEKTLGYAPPPCELARIVNDTIAACDALDGKTDGVVGRTDLCKLQYNTSSSIGNPYHCPATNGSSMGSMMSPPTPVQNGTVTAQGAAVAQAINNGLFDGNGRQVYMSYQPSSTYDDAQTRFNFSSNQWYVAASGIGVSYINLFLNQINSAQYSLEGVTYDTLREYILEGLQKYAGTLQTVWPDLSDFHNNGGKIIHYHGESDFSIPTDSSVIYQESVRKTMYPNMTYNESYTALNDWYRLYLIPGAGHCSPSSTQPNGPWPQTTFETLIEWVENGQNPQTLNGTVLQGPNRGQQQQICSYPLRPYWSSNLSDVQCIYPDQASLQTWYPNLNSIPLPVY